MATKTLCHRLIRSVTLDFDATLIEAHKQDAEFTDEKFPGYDPLLCFVAETGMVLRGLFRPGNASPSANALPVQLQPRLDQLDHVVMRWLVAIGEQGEWHTSFADSS